MVVEIVPVTVMILPYRLARLTRGVAPAPACQAKVIACVVVIAPLDGENKIGTPGTGARRYQL